MNFVSSKNEAYPVGAVIAFAGQWSSTVREKLADLGWLPCDGSGYSQNDPEYQALFAQIRFGYGGDDDNFYVPQYNGTFHRGVDSGAKRDPDAKDRTAPRPSLPIQGNQGDNVGSIQSSMYPSHDHGYTEYSVYHDRIDDFEAHVMGALGSTSSGTAAVTKGTAKINISSETRPVNSYVHFLIKYKDLAEAAEPSGQNP